MIETTEEIWTNEVIHTFEPDDQWSPEITFGELKYSAEISEKQIGVGMKGAYLYLNESEVDQYIQDLRSIASAIFGDSRPALEVVDNDDSTED